MYKAVGNTHIMSGKDVIAISFLGHNGYYVRILQGMDRTATTERLVNECPEFCRANNLTANIRPDLFSKEYGNKFLKGLKK